MRKIQQHWQELFYFTLPERRGLLLLCSLIVVMFSVGRLIPAYLPSGKGECTAEEKAWLDRQVQMLDMTPSVKPGNPVELSPKRFFDANEVSKNELIEAGCPGRIAHNWARYLEKGGRFRKVEDVRRIYGMTDGVYAQLKPFIRLKKAPAPENSFNGRGDTPYRTGSRPCREIDINQADSLDWESLPGIGAVLASRILRFRERLGGFYALDQVGETYGLQDSVFQKLRPCLRLSPPFRKIPLNQATEEQLRFHPYISWKLAKIIVAYRQEHGPFHALSDLANIQALTPEDLKRLEPYLAIVP